MDKREEIAKEYLKSLGFDNITFEPLGVSTFPDFAINENIGVEVRILNRNHIDDTKIEADNLHSKHKKEIIKILNSIQLDGTTFFISFDVKSNNGIIDENCLFNGLQEYLQTCDTAISNHNINSNLDVVLTPCTPDNTKKFKLNTVNVPFFLVEEQYLKDIQFCIDDKQEKICNLKKKSIDKFDSFSEFWLILVDYLLQDDLSEYDFESISLKDFSKVIVIDTNAKEQKILEIRA